MDKGKLKVLKMLKNIKLINKSFEILADLICVLKINYYFQQCNKEESIYGINK